MAASNAGEGAGEVFTVRLAPPFPCALAFRPVVLLGGSRVLAFGLTGKSTEILAAVRGVRTRGEVSRISLGDNWRITGSVSLDQYG